ncbi:tRNA guanosine(34) transglycosylase Tgt [Candidatus Uhrbacteria bacterium]|nr:tRNA guanosine(34) transglycosylase Tgt [Candidatus Uhrbacteria bacterium]
MTSPLTITAKLGAARTGVLRTSHGDIQTPCFMPIATVGAVRHVAPHELKDAGATMILANTYHLMLRPGAAAVAERGGLHRFMGWDGPILTDSGGFQVFSLGARAAARNGKGLVALTPEGVHFRSHLDGSAHLLTPELAVDYQRALGSDIAMALDVCPPQPCSSEVLHDAVGMTTAWAQRTIAHADATGVRDRMMLFGIVQGGSDPTLRQESAAAITALPFDGFAIGGVAVGESKEAVRRAVEIAAPLLPEDHPRYLMGIGTPDDLVHAVRNGCDFFDCVLPTRGARHGRVYRWRNRDVSLLHDQTAPWWEEFSITNERYKTMDVPIDPQCSCLACTTTSLSYLRHLAVIQEALGQRLLSIHNLTFYLDLMRRLREDIARNGAASNVVR